jgi:hypothetical protein
LRLITPDVHRIHTLPQDHSDSVLDPSVEDELASRSGAGEERRKGGGTLRFEGASRDLCVRVYDEFGVDLGCARVVAGKAGRRERSAERERPARPGGG